MKNKIFALLLACLLLALAVFWAWLEGAEIAFVYNAF